MMIALVGLNANAAIYIVGDGPLGGWAFDGGQEMTPAGDGTYTYEMTIAEDAESAVVYFAFADGRGADWDEFNGTMRIGPTSGDQKIEDTNWVETQKAGGDNGAYFFEGIKGENYTVTYDETNSKFKVDGEFAQPPVGGDTYTVAGSPAALFGTEWAPGNADNDMTLVDGLYTWSKNNVELAAGSIEFKVVVNHAWGTAYPSSNFVKPVEVKGIYNVKITFNADTKDVACELTLVEELPDTGEHTYTVAGAPAALFGTEWTPSNADNDMELVEGLYTWEKKNVALTAGTIAFKVTQDHAWTIAYPSENYTYNIEANGNYDVKITFNEESKDVNITVTAVEVSADFYAVAGSPASFFGAEWNPNFDANKMTLVEGLYTWEKKDIEVTEEGLTIEFKVVKNNNWTTCWPADNIVYSFPGEGTYDMIITYNPETNEVLYNAEKQGGEEPEITVYTVVGPQNVFTSNWDATDTDNDMVENEGIYTWTKDGVELTAGFSFKVVGNHSYDVYEWPVGYGSNYDVAVEEAGVYTIEITFDPAAEESARITCNLTKTGEIEPTHYEGDVYIMGEVNGIGWHTNAGYKMTRYAEQNLYTAFVTTAGENDGYSYFSFTKQLSENDQEWEAIAPYRFGAVSDGDYWVNPEDLGNVISLTDNGQSLRLPAGNWSMVVSVDDMTLIINDARGDVSEDMSVDITDVTVLIDMLLSSGEVPAQADVNRDGAIDITDVTVLIDYLLNNTWPAAE